MGGPAALTSPGPESDRKGEGVRNSGSLPERGGTWSPPALGLSATQLVLQVLRPSVLTGQ